MALRQVMAAHSTRDWRTTPAISGEQCVDESVCLRKRQNFAPDASDPLTDIRSTDTCGARLRRTASPCLAIFTRLTAIPLASDETQPNRMHVCTAISIRMRGPVVGSSVVYNRDERGGTNQLLLLPKCRSAGAREYPKSARLIAAASNRYGSEAARRVLKSDANRSMALSPYDRSTTLAQFSSGVL